MGQGEFRSNSRRRPATFTLLLSAAALAAVSCTASTGGGAASTGPPPILTISPANGSQGILPGAPIVVAAKNGKLREVKQWEVKRR